jgi:hypothetical protein
MQLNATYAHQETLHNSSRHWMKTLCLDGVHGMCIWVTRASRSVVISSHVLPLRKFSMAFRRAACP